MSDENKTDGYRLKSKAYELVPPDGGWGYLVSIAATINFSTTTGFVGCFGVLYNDFIIETEMNSASITLLAGISSMSIALAGFFTSPLLKIMTKRKLGLLASIIYTCGCFGTVIMKTPFLFFISQGILQGAGLGLHYNLSCTIINDYFLNKKVLIINFVQMATGFLTMVAPIFVKWSLDQYGVRGTLLLIGGISLHNFFAVLLMQPVEWHMKKVEVSKKKKKRKRMLLDTVKVGTVVFAEFLLENYETKKADTIVKCAEIEKNNDMLVMPELTKDGNRRSRIRKFFESLIDPSVCKTYLPSCASFGPAMSAVCDGISLVILPAYLYSIGWSQEHVAMSITLYGFGDLAMRVILTLISKWLYKISIQWAYLVGIGLAIISRFGMIWTSSVTIVMAYFTLMGVAHCSIAVLIPLVVSDSVSPEKFTSAMGICLLFHGVLCIVLGPAIGAVRDITNSYSNAFYTIISFYAVIVVLWATELIMKKQRRKCVNTISESSQLNKVTT